MEQRDMISSTLGASDLVQSWQLYPVCGCEDSMVYADRTTGVVRGWGQ